MRYVLDTNTALYLLADRIPAGLPEGEYFVSVITELELLSFQKLDAAGEQGIRALLARVSVEELRSDIKTETIRIRRAKRLKLPDAVVAATAKVLVATLLTNDRDFAGIDGLACEPVAISN